MRISDFFNLSTGHVNFDFIDIDTNKDTELFIDPCLIETEKTPFCKKAKLTLDSFFYSFFNLYRSNTTYSQKEQLLSHAHEINATKLGYGNGNNGKAKTAEGIIETFESLKNLADSNVPLSKAIDLNIFVPDFAEDCLSDFITNILFYELSEFTLMQCQKYSVDTQDVVETHYFWDVSSSTWKKYSGKGLYIDGKLILLVPKNIVRHSYYYTTEQYFRMIILCKKQRELTTYDDKGKEIFPSKKYLRESLLKTNSDILDVCEKETVLDPYLLMTHHNNISSCYKNRNMSNQELDYWVYER